MIDPCIQIFHGDCLEILGSMPDCSVDSVVTDPPYGLKFMNKHWDCDVPKAAVWSEVLRVLKPGGHLLSFFGTRTYHRGVVQVEDAGFEIRDTIMWVYGSGFPKSQDVSRAIDDKAGAQRKKGPINTNRAGRLVNQTKEYITDGGWSTGNRRVTDDPPATAAAAQWQGWGTALKPALEPIVVARKPIIGTVAANVLAYGTGALNIDACRTSAVGEDNPSIARRQGAINHLSTKKAAETEAAGRMVSRQSPEAYRAERVGKLLGRWPANLIHDGSEGVLAGFPETNSPHANGNPNNPRHGSKNRQVSSYDWGAEKESHDYRDTGSAARFFYCAKTSRSDRNDGLQDMPKKPLNWSSGERSPDTFQSSNTNRNVRNHHPTVKPTDLMRYLCRLITPAGGVVLDPYMGSGSTLRGAALEGFSAIGIELDVDYIEIAQRRVEAVWPFSVVMQRG